MSNKPLMVAIDFGNTFSGYAYSFVNDFQVDPLKIISTNHFHTHSRAGISLKTPTCILFSPNEQFHSFGYEAEEKYSDLLMDGKHQAWYYFQRFKMMLYNGQDFKRDTKWQSSDGKPFPAIKILSCAIEYLVSHMLSTMDGKLAGVKRDDIHWVLTVPAIWEDKAKDFMRTAAEMAGIKGANLVIALEPEAASVYCKYLPVEKLSDTGRSEISCFETGRRYLVVDVGGGTVDVTVCKILHDCHITELFKANGGPWGRTKVDTAFTDFLKSLCCQKTPARLERDFKDDYMDLLSGKVDITVHEVSHDGHLQELFKANGGQWGGTTVDEAYQELFRSLCGQKTFARLLRDFNDDFMDLLREFEVKKRTVSHELDQNVTFKIPIMLQDAFQDDHEKIFQIFVAECHDLQGKLVFAGDKMRLEPSLMTSFFEKTCNTIVGHLRDVFGKIKPSCMLVGGFSELPICQNVLKKVFGKKIFVPNEAGPAILKGAVIFGHQHKIISSRVSRYTYGISVIGPAQDGERKELLIQEEDDSWMCRGHFSKHVEVGEEIPIGALSEGMVYIPSDKVNKVNGGMKIAIYVFTKKNPKFIIDKGCIHLGEVSVGGGGFQGVKVTMIFCSTELGVDVISQDTGKVTNAKFDFFE